MNALSDLLLAVANALLWPVVLLLLGFFAWTVTYLGGALAEALQRRRHRPSLARFVGELMAAPDRRVSPEDAPAPPGLAGRGVRLLRETPGAPGKVLDDLSLEGEQLLGRLTLGVRLGPILGLTGTLIPLGPALKALSEGDVETLSSRLVVAFTTTVLGLVVGAACFAMVAVRRRWYMTDLSDVEFVAGRMGPS